MNCPKCSNDNTTVIDSRQKGATSRRRRYECYDCGHRFTTIEYYADDYEAKKAAEEKTTQQLDAIKSAVWNCWITLNYTEVGE